MSKGRDEGSSPYARGARVNLLRLHRVAGIIPVCTGSTYTSDTIDVWCRDHPRMHGEHRNLRCNLKAVKGSSPYARGARVF